MTTNELIQEHRIVARPSILGYTGKYCAAMLRRVSLDGSRIEVWPQTHVEAQTLDEAVALCAKKCVEFTASKEYEEATLF